MADRDSISSRISPACPPETQQILTASWAHDTPQIKKLTDAPGKASLQDPTTGETPLHAAIRACGSPSEDDTPEDLQAAHDTVRELLQWGAIWNDVDDANETPGCVAARLGRGALYDLCVGAGVRAEMLFGLLDGYEELGSEGEGEEDDDAEIIDLDVEDVAASGDAVVPEDGDEAPELVIVENGAGEDADMEEAPEEEEEEEEEEDTTPRFQPPKLDTDANVESETYLRSKLTYSDGKLVDDAGNGVMMAWETDIMRQSVAALLPGDGSGTDTTLAKGKRILNIGFGMGIIDTMFADTQPAVHHIIEAHEEVLSHIAGAASSPADDTNSTPTTASKFGPDWELRSPTPGAYKIHAGRWQEICPQLLAAGQIYDAIYFDTFGESYGQLRKFFTEYIPGLLDEGGVFGFFNGLGADRKICYDVYTQVVEMHLADAGLDVDWKVIDVDMADLAREGEGEWEGVKRRYWTLDSEFVLFLFLFLSLFAMIYTVH
jgi:protein arginine N-methyltransferase 2